MVQFNLSPDFLNNQASLPEDENAKKFTQQFINKNAAARGGPYSMYEQQNNPTWMNDLARGYQITPPPRALGWMGPAASAVNSGVEAGGNAIVNAANYAFGNPQNPYGGKPAPANRPASAPMVPPQTAPENPQVAQQQQVVGGQDNPQQRLSKLQQKYQQMPAQYGSNITAYGQLGPKIGSMQNGSSTQSLYDPSGRTQGGNFQINSGTNMYAGGGSQGFNTVTNPYGKQMGQTTYGDANASAPFSQSAGSMSNEAQAAFNPLMQQAQKYGGSVRGFTAGPNGENGFGFALNPANLSPEQNRNIFQQQHEMLQNQIAQGGKLEASDAARLAASNAAQPTWQQFGAGKGGISAHNTWNDRGAGQDRSINPYNDYQNKLDFMKQQQFQNQATMQHLQNEGTAAANPQQRGMSPQDKIDQTATMAIVKHGIESRFKNNDEMMKAVNSADNATAFEAIKGNKSLHKNWQSWAKQPAGKDNHLSLAIAGYRKPGMTNEQLVKELNSKFAK